MNSQHSAVLRHLKTQIPNPLTAVFHRLNHTTTIQHHQDYPNFIADQLSNCSNLHHLNQLHAHIITTNFLESQPSPFHYNNIARSYTRLHSPINALHVYTTMSRAGVTPDTYTIPIILKAACQVFDRKLAGQLHGVAIKIGVEQNMYCESGFITLYVKGGEFENAYKVFDENAERKLGSWNAIIAGLSQGGRGKEAIDMFVKLKREGFLPDDITMVSVTSACGSLGDLNLGLQLHKYVFEARSLARSDILMMNSLVDMYGKCGRMDLANQVFSEMEERNVSSWTSMIVGYAMHGQVREALECFDCMKEAGVRPNHVTFVGVLSACVHGGMVEEGKYYFNMMKNEYGIKPIMQHYGCMVDMLGRAGLFEEAKEVVDGMPMEANVVVWGCLLGACEKHGNVEMGEFVAKQLMELESEPQGLYVVLSNIYASNGMWAEVDRIRGLMKEQRLDKVPAYSMSASTD